MSRLARGTLQRAHKYVPRTIERRNPRYVIIGRRLEFLRRVVNKESREKLAERVDVSASAIRQWDCGQTLPSALNMIMVHEHYNVSMDYLYCIEFRGLADAQLLMLPDSMVLRRPGPQGNKRHWHTADVELLR